MRFPSVIRYPYTKSWLPTLRPESLLRGQLAKSPVPLRHACAMCLRPAKVGACLAPL